MFIPKSEITGKQLQKISEKRKKQKLTKNQNNTEE